MAAESGKIVDLANAMITAPVAAADWLVIAPVVIPIRGTCIVCTCHRLAPGETDPRVCRSVLSPIHGGSAATQNKRKPVSQWAGQGLYSDAARS